MTLLELMEMMIISKFNELMEMMKISKFNEELKGHDLQTFFILN